PASSGQVAERAVKDRVTLSHWGASKDSAVKQRGSCMGCGEARQKDESLNTDDPKAFLIKYLMEAITGKEFKVSILDLSGEQSTEDMPEDMPAVVQNGTGQGSTGEGWGLIYDSYESHYEAESTSVAIEGYVRTQDGKQIAFSLNLNMSREYFSEQSFSVRAGDAAKVVDPLVINFGGAAAELTDTKFAFDLDADGDHENISFVRPGSGLLVFDRNGDGIVNDGSELFGPKTGNGFAELSQYDEDHNQWIDENDSIFDRLFIWTRDDNGNDSLNSLLSSNVGAIHLGAVESKFDLRGSGNTLNGQVSRTGVYLEEDGVAKSIQQLDLTV
ncbi:MAG: hypothetical protein RBS57_20965, partial [Desulforhabdus sp.]|nr:hypothetical protein [Desulforhabdus sp.]